MSTSEPPPSTGLIAGKYELLGMIGRGGMGSVWEGRHASLGTSVAIKFIESEYAESQEARSRFDNEARAAATIQSKHAIQIFDHGVTHDGKPYIVMELLVGEPLDKRIDRLGRLTLQDTARILQQVCRGLQRAHERGIIHRDLKPENIFLVRTEEDDEEIAKVLDFGIAKIKSPEGMGISSSTKTGAVLGTPFFMSPEQARGLRGVDHRTDIWSLAVIAFKCVTGVLPFDGESVGDLLVKICTAPPPVPSHIVPGLPQSFDAWFARALDRDPARRFSSATELSDALAYSGGVSVRRPVSSGTPEVHHPGFMATMPQVQPSTPGPRGTMRTPGPITGSSPQQGIHGGPSATSAPFTQSNPSSGVPKSGRGMMVALLLVVAGSLGTAAFFAVQRFAGKKHIDDANVTVSDGNMRPAVSASAGNNVGGGGAPIASAAPLATLDAGAAIAVNIAPLASAPPAINPGPGKKHPAPSHPTPPAISGPKLPPVPAPVPPPSKAPIDPGY